MYTYSYLMYALGLVQGRVDQDPTLTLILSGSGPGSVYGDPAQG